MKKLLMLVILLLLVACSPHENQEAIDYLKSSESNITSKFTDEKFVWEN